MKAKLNLLSLLLFTVAFLLFLPKLAYADTFTLSGSVKDSSGTAISGATVTVNDTNNDQTTTDSSGNYTMSIPSGTYNVQVMPPSGNFSSATAMAQSITANTTLNFILAPSGTVTLSGRLYDSLGNALNNQFIFLNSGNNTVAATSTNSSGAYSLQVSPGTYSLFINNNVSNDPQNVSGSYSIRVNNYALSQSIIANFTLPMKKVIVHTQDVSSSAVSNVDITTNHAGGSNVNIGGGVSTATVNSGYDSPGPTTDSSGNATLWFFAATYTFTATPPNGSTFVTTTSTGNQITTDTTKTITMQQPVTLSGHMYDALGNALSNQFIFLKNSSNNTVAATSTDANGVYSLQAAPGTYTLFMNNNVTNDPQNVAGTYSVRVNSFSLTQNKTLDITLPMKKITMHVQDIGGSGISGVQLTSNIGGSSSLSIAGGIANATGSSGYDSPVTTNSSGNVTLWLFPSTFTFTAAPPSGSNYGTATLSSQHITADTNLTMTLTQPVTISGHLYDSLGNPLNNQFLYLSSGSTTIASTSTNSSGAYSLQVNSGTYNLNINNNVSNDPQNVSGDYSIKATNYLISQNTTLNVTLPMKKVSVHVQDAIGNSVSGVQLTTTTGNASGLSIGGSILNVTGSSTYGANSIAGPATDNSGNVTLWLLPANYGSFFATPPSGSIYSTLTLNNVSITGDQTELISLQYNHATPITTSTLSPMQNSDGTYSNPVSVTLSATAASGYTVANTYYAIDGGSQQTYITPFTVSGNGSHIIHYWSVDNSGVLESKNIKTFTIVDSNALISAINAGGSASGNFVSDTNFNGGSQYSSNASVDTSGIDTPAQQSVYQTVRYGNFTYTIPNLTANAAYTLKLHFNELYWGTSLVGGGEDSRVFNVSVNGTQVLHNYDIYQTAGGSNKAVVEQIPVTANSNGHVTLQFSTVTDNALVNGIEIYSGTLPSPTPTPTPTPVSSLSINAGSTTVSSFVSDKDFSGGQPYTSSASVDTTGVTSPASESVYQSVRYGNFTYTVPNLYPNTQYTVKLHFNELYWGTSLSGNAGGVGSRVFDTSINGQQVLNNYDIYADAGGSNKAVVKQFTATSNAQGKISIVFTTVTDNAMVNGIEISQ
ncbi:MAG TPA: malectin domain-containing carbohydrate-binding protein [Candidatus Saccharimonadales bacterium]|nr:malectin domain-containing carbohydrate-binding protein [Candidatus Saccharimonadales bacterium]